MAREDINLDFLNFEELVLKDEELINLCLQTQEELLANINYDGWCDAKFNHDNRIEWHLLPNEDRWACFIFEQILWELSKIQKDEIEEIGETYNREIDWFQLFIIIKSLIKELTSESGYILSNDPLKNFIIAYYKMLMYAWDLSDDREGVSDEECSKMIRFLAGEVDLMTTMNNLLREANNYFVDLHKSDNNDDGNPSPLELMPV